MTVKGLILYIKEHNLKTVTQILTENKVEGISFFEVQGRGKLDRETEARTLEGYKTGKKFTPEFLGRIRVETIVTDLAYEDIVKRIREDKSIQGKIFVFNVEESLDL